MTIQAIQDKLEALRKLYLNPGLRSREAIALQARVLKVLLREKTEGKFSTHGQQEIAV